MDLKKTIALERAVASSDFSEITTRRGIPYRRHNTWLGLVTGRFLGYRRPLKQPPYWTAKYRDRRGKYHETRIGFTDNERIADGLTFLSYDQAVAKAWDWFRENAATSSDPNPIGRTTELLYCPVGDVYTLGHALNDYLEWKRLSAARSHFYIIVALINHHLIHRFGPLALSELTGEVFRGLFQEILETPPRLGGRLPPAQRQPLFAIDESELRTRKKTINTLIGILRTTLQLAWETGKTDNDRLWRALRPFRNVDRPRILHLNRLECRKLLKHSRPDLRLLVMAALYTGCRSGELLSMQVCHVAKDGYGVFVLPHKTTQHRFVFLPDEGMSFFLRLIKGRAPTDLLFRRADGKPWGVFYMALFRRAVLNAGLPREFAFHGLRHTYASQLVQAGTPLIVVSEQLGHLHTFQVSRSYSHLAPQIRESEVRQRFAILNSHYARMAKHRAKSLARLRGRLHGTKWRTYAKITDLTSRSNKT